MQSVIFTTQLFKKKNYKNKINVVLMSLNERNELLKIQCTWASLRCMIPHLSSSFPITKKKKKQGKMWKSAIIRTHVYSKRKLDWNFVWTDWWARDHEMPRHGVSRWKRGFSTERTHWRRFAIVRGARGSINARGHIHLGGANRINLRIYPRREVSSHSMKVKLSTVDREVVDREPC